MLMRSWALVACAFALVAVDGREAFAEVGNDEASAEIARRMRSAERYANGERYDVMITPPHRPGSQPVASLSAERAMRLPARGHDHAATTAPAEDPAAAVPSKPGERIEALEARHQIDGGWTNGVADDAGARAAPRKPEAVERAERKAPAAPVASTAASALGRKGKVMQVGAYRRHRSATDLKEKLQRSFDDVYVSETISGGQPLYRVRVAPGSSAATVAELKSKLVKGGYSCFAVEETSQH